MSRKDKNTESETSTKDEQSRKEEPLMKKYRFQLNAFDNPGISLVSKPLNGANYHAWAQSMRISIGTNKKLGFITGKAKKPAEDSEGYED